MINSHYKKVIKYFRQKAAKYDLVDKQLYWRLSDTLLAKIVRVKLVKSFSKKKELKVLDAGAGTGRWSLILYDFLKRNHKLRFDLVDITKEMLVEADRKIKKKGLSAVMKTRLGNIENLFSYRNNYYDLAISFYNVLSFSEKPSCVLKEIFKKLKRGGLYASIVANKYHAYFFAILNNRVGGLTDAKKGKIRYTDEMPFIHCFTPNEISRLYRQSGFKKVEVIGLPNFVYPNIEDTKIEGQSKKNKNLLEDKKNFRRILELEFQEYFNQDVAGRGNVLLVIGRK